MKEDNIVQDKSYAFALRIVKLCRYLVERKREYVLSRQLLSSGTSIGANVEEAIGAHSRPDFLAKLTIAYKEARESRFWIRLLGDSGYLTGRECKSMFDDVEELLRIIGAIQRTVRAHPMPQTSGRTSTKPR
jgi:four helix bundle protein